MHKNIATLFAYCKETNFNIFLKSEKSEDVNLLSVTKWELYCIWS